MIIYKYLDYDGSLATIRDNSVLLKTPSEYNDPFDCYISTTQEEKDRSYSLFINYQLFVHFYDFLVKNNKKATSNKTLAKITKSNLQMTATQIKKNKKYTFQPYLAPFAPLAYKYLQKGKIQLKTEFRQMLKNAFEKMRNSIVVSCFGSSYDSILMWAHYADKHRGTCIEFEIDDKDFKKVTYSKTMPSFQLYKSFEYVLAYQFLGEEMDDSEEKYSFMYMPLLTKSIDWAYEGEVRCVFSAKKSDPKIHKEKDKEGKEIMLLKMPVIKTIYVGYKASEKLISRIKQRSGDIPIMKMEMKENEYGLIATKLDIDK